MTEAAELQKKEKMRNFGLIGENVHSDDFKKEINHSESAKYDKCVHALFLEHSFCRPNHEQSYNNWSQYSIFNCKRFLAKNKRIIIL